MSVTVPAAIPVTTPVPLIVAVPGALLAHVPPAEASVNDVVRPTHTVSVPVMDAGSGFTVTIPVVIQPVGSV